MLVKGYSSHFIVVSDSFVPHCILGVVDLLLKYDENHHKQKGPPDFNFEHQDSEGRTGFSLACEEGHTDVVKMLVDSGKIYYKHKDNTPEGKTGFHWACENGHTGVIDVLVEKFGKEVSGQTPTFLKWAE